MAYDYKAFRVDAVGNAFDFCDFAVGNNSHNNFGVIMFITGFGFKKGYAAVDFRKNRVGDFPCFSCDDFDFGSGFTEYKGFVKDIGICKSENNSVKDKVNGFEH